MIDEAADEANEIVEAEAELNRHRADLDNLARLLTAEGRRLNGAAPALPAQISRALYPVDRQLTGADRSLVLTDWPARPAPMCGEDKLNMEKAAVLMGRLASHPNFEFSFRTLPKLDDADIPLFSTVYRKAVQPHV